MLIEIKSKTFREKTISFHAGVNVVLGDENASNSIGKSNLLLIVDFVFGGDTYLTHSKDVIEELGEHEFYFCFEFDKKYKFKRSTRDSSNIFKCNDSYETGESISTNEFTKFLQKQYDIDYIEATFRSLVGVYLRIWGKDNYDIKKPLKRYKDDAKEKEGIDNLIKLFNKYSDLKKINDKIKENTEFKKVLNGMYKKAYANKITKTQYRKNKEEIERIENDINDLKNNVLKYVINVEELIDEEVITLKKEKNNLLKIKDGYENRLLRINRNLDSKSHISSKHLEKLQEFFPKANIEKINKIESFHKKIKNILAAEIRKNKKEIEDKLSIVTQEIDEVDHKIISFLDKGNNPNVVIEKVYDLTLKLKETKSTNKFYQETIEKTENIKSAKEELIEKSKSIIDGIENSINEEMGKINKKIYDNETSPVINIENSKYILYKPNDTGTGTSYMNLIIFDLAVLKLTNLPILAHDSILFKNVSNNVMENLIKYYSSFEKQIFIAIDQHKKFKDVVSILEAKKIVKLDSDKVLFTKKWNKS